MHRQFKRASYRKSIEKKEGDENTKRLLEYDPEAPETFCTRIGKFVPDNEAEKFQIFIGIVIVINAIVLGLETDLGEQHFMLCEHMFAVIFTFEMVLRCSQIGICAYASRPSNLFDALLVTTGDFDLWASPFLLSSSGEKANGGSSQALKLLRMFRVMRIVRLFKMFHELQIIMEAFIKALHTVMWVGLLTIILNYIVAVFLTQTVGHNASMWGDEEEQILIWFGSIGHSMRTLFIIITLAEWDYIALVVSKRVNGFLVFLVAIAYITLTAFTMVSLITGIISEELCGAQREDEVHKMEMVEKGKSELAANVTVLLESFDDDKSGTLSDEEVKRALESPDLKFMERLQALDIAMSMEEIHTLLQRIKDASGDDEIPIDSVAQALKHLSGSASSSAVWDIKLMILQMQGEHTMVRETIDQLAEHQGAHIVHHKKCHTHVHEKLQEHDKHIENMKTSVKSRQLDMESKLDTLISRMEKFDANMEAINEKGLESRVQKVEEMMHSICNVLMSRPGAGIAQGGIRMEEVANQALLQARISETIIVTDN
jgi:hypothetical protein